VGYGSAQVKSFDSASGSVRITYALSGPHAPPGASAAAPDAVVAAAEAADAALAKFAELGYRAIVSDGDSPCASNGGDDKVDVYLVDFPSADGKAVADHCSAGGAVRACSGFVLVENDFARSSYANLREGMNTVVPHELFHLVQNAYDADVERWWAEGSAQWAAKQLHPELLDLERNLPAYFSQPWRPLDVPSSGVAAAFLYATAIWPVFLSERHGDDLVRRVFEGLAAGESTVFASAATALAAQGSSLGQEFLWFAAYNAATGSRARSGFGYEHAANYPLVALSPLVGDPGTSIDDVGSGFGAFYYSVESSEPLSFTLEADPTRMAALLVPMSSGSLDLGAAAALPAETDGSAVVVVAGQSSAKTDAPFRLRIGESEGGGDSASAGASGSEKLSSSCALVRGIPGRARAQQEPSLALGFGLFALLFFTMKRAQR
jgi:hypothetical protein